MKKSIIVFLLLVMAYGQGAEARAAELRRSSTIENSVIRVGDIFSFAGAANMDETANSVIGRAPAPGKKTVLNSFQLAAVAKRYGIDWRPNNRFERSVVSRAGKLINVEEIEDAIIQALIDNGMDMDKERQVKLFNTGRRIYAPVNQAVSFTIHQTSYNRRTGRLTATMNIPHDDGDIKQISLTGRVMNMIRVPVLNRRIKAGDMIRKGDIEWIEIEARRLREGFVTEAETLIDQQAVRLLQADKPVRNRDIRSRVLVSKGSLAMLTLRTNKMLLTVRVLAMNDAGMGETVRVLNTRSKKTVEGIVIGAGRVTVPVMSLEQGS